MKWFNVFYRLILVGGALYYFLNLKAALEKNGEFSKETPTGREYQPNCFIAKNKKRHYSEKGTIRTCVELASFRRECRYFELYCVSPRMRQHTIHKYDIR